MNGLFTEVARPSLPPVALPEGVQPPVGGGLVLEAWMDSQACAICRGEWPGWPTQEGFGVLRDAVRLAGADEGALWLVDDIKRELRPCFSVGDHVGIFLREIRQPLSSGLISMVFFTENSICEADVGGRSEYSPHVDLRLGAKTKAMVAVPVFFAQRCRGVFSAVLFEEGIKVKNKDVFQASEFETLSRAAALWSELMDSQLAGAGMRFSTTAARS